MIEDMTETTEKRDDMETLRQQARQAQKILVGLGAEWKGGGPRVMEGYEALAELLDEKDYFIVTTNTDAVIFQTRLDAAGSRRPAATRPGGSVPGPAPRTSGNRGRFPTTSAPTAARR